MVNYICIYKDVNLKSLLQHSVTWLAKACLPHHLCYYPAVFFCHLQLIALQKFNVHFKTVYNRYKTLIYLCIRNMWVSLLWQETWLGLNNNCISQKMYMINRWYLPIIITINHIYNLCFDAAHHSPCLFHFLWDGSSFGKPSQCPSIHLQANNYDT